MYEVRDTRRRQVRAPDLHRVDYMYDVYGRYDADSHGRTSHTAVRSTRKATLDTTLIQTRAHRRYNSSDGLTD